MDLDQARDFVRSNPRAVLATRNVTGPASSRVPCSSAWTRTDD